MCARVGTSYCHCRVHHLLDFLRTVHCTEAREFQTLSGITAGSTLMQTPANTSRKQEHSISILKAETTGESLFGRSKSHPTLTAGIQLSHSQTLTLFQPSPTQFSPHQSRRTFSFSWVRGKHTARDELSPEVSVVSQMTSWRNLNTSSFKGTLGEKDPNCTGAKKQLICPVRHTNWKCRRVMVLINEHALRSVFKVLNFPQLTISSVLI